MKRMQVQDLVIRCRTAAPVSIYYVEGAENKSIVYRSLADVDGSDLTAEVLRFNIIHNMLLLEVKPYGKE